MAEGIANDQLNPLNVPEILEHVLTFCSFEDLKACRQVSPFWEQNSRKAWASSSIVVYGPGSKASADKRRLLQSLNLAKEKGQKPLFENFLLSGNFNLNARWKFWELLGPFVKHLELRECKFQGVAAFRNVVFGSFPSMKHLKLDNVTITIGKNEEHPLQEMKWEDPAFGVNCNMKSLVMENIVDPAISKMELLSHFAHLEAFTLGWRFDSDPWFRCVEEIRRHDPNMLKLKKVNILDSREYETIPAAVQNVLVDPRVPLEALSIELARFAGEGDLLRDIIRTHAGTLKMLELSRNLGRVQEPSQIFQNLGGVELKIEVVKLGYGVFTSLEFLKYTPNLKYFSIEGIGYGMDINTDWSSMTDVSLPKCWKLDIYEEFIRNDGAFESLIRCFPNLQELHVSGIDNRRFSFICEHCPELLRLRIRDCTVDDCGLTGLDEDDVSKINDKRRRHNRKRVTVITAPRASISSLKGLRSFEMECNLAWDSDCDKEVWGMDDLIEVGPAGVTHGFQELPHLQYLRIANYKVTLKQKRALFRHVPDCEISCDDLLR